MNARYSVYTLMLLCGLASTNVLHAQPVAESKSTDSSPTTLTFSQAVILGFVEGATEYLPVSSTGHLVIAEHLLGLGGDEQKKAAADSLAICIQFGAILAVVVLYFGRIRQIVTGMLGQDKDGPKLLINLIVAFFPAAVCGLLFKDLIKKHLLSPVPIGVAFFVGAILILVQSWGRKPSDEENGKDLSQMSWQNALFVGLMQCLALWPGFSRSLATILGCRWMKIRMTSAVEFSFLLGLLTLTAATAYEALKHGKEMIAHYGFEMPLVSLVVAFVAAVLSVKFMVGALNKFGLSPFAYYRIVLAFICVCWITG